MGTWRGYSVPILSSLFVASIVIVSMLSLPFFNKLMTFSASKPALIVPMVELQKSTSEDHVRAARTDNSSTGFYGVRSLVRRKPRLGRGQELEQGLARARASIRKASLKLENSTTIGDDDYFPSGMVYRNARAFYQSYVEMEKRLQVYVYLEGDLPIIHDGPCKDIYSIEGRFIHEMEHGVGRFRTRNPYRAHVFFMPFSVTWMVKYFYQPLSHNHEPILNVVADYVRVVSMRYPFWNRTRGANHFMIACHDWGPHASSGNEFLFNTSIRVLCNANTSEGFKPQKDISLPEIFLYGGTVPDELLSPSPDTAPRPYLAFFAGGVHGPIRPILLQHWKNRDNDLRVYEYLPKDQNYYSFMLKSKFCLCPSGHEVASPRIVEAIYAECVPVIISKNYVLPFSDVLRWEAFSIQVDVSEIPRLKEVLSAVPEGTYRRLKEGLKAVRRHFLLNSPAKRFDVFHMILHSVWLRRINVQL